MIGLTSMTSHEKGPACAGPFLWLEAGFARSGVQSGPQFEAGLGGPVAHLFAKLLGVLHIHQGPKTHRDVHVPGAKCLNAWGTNMVLSTQARPWSLYSSATGIMVNPSFAGGTCRGGIRAGRGRSGMCPLGKHQPHAFGEPLAHGGPGEAAAVLALPVDPNRAQQACPSR